MTSDYLAMQDKIARLKALKERIAFKLDQCYTRAQHYEETLDSIDNAIDDMEYQARMVQNRPKQNFMQWVDSMGKRMGL